MNKTKNDNDEAETIVLSKINELHIFCQAGKIPDYEEILKNGYSKLILPNDVVIDVGAHTGRHLKNFIQLVGCYGMVHGIEPLPEQFNYLKATYRQTNTQLHNIALSDFEGQSDFCFAEGQPEESGLKQRIYNNPKEVIPKNIKVQVRTINNYFEKIDRLSYVKIDAEGAEISILNGGEKIINKFRPFISVEYGYPSYSVYGLENVSLFNWAEKNNYYITDIYGNFIYTRELFKIACDSVYWDYFLVPMEKEGAFLKSLIEG